MVDKLYTHLAKVFAPMGEGCYSLEVLLNGSFPRVSDYVYKCDHVCKFTHTIEQVSIHTCVGERVSE